MRVLLCPLIFANSCSWNIGASTDVASCRRSWSRRSLNSSGFGRLPSDRQRSSYRVRARILARMNARVAAPGVTVKIGPRVGRPARYCRSDSRAHGVNGTSLDVPFFVSGRWTTPCMRSTCSRRMWQISARLIAVSAARVTMTGNSFDDVDWIIQSSSLRGQSAAATPRMRIRLITRLSLASSTVGRRTSCTGFASSVHPQSFLATVNTCDKNASRRTTVAGALPFDHSSRSAIRSVFLIRSIGRPAIRVANHVLAMDFSAVSLFLSGDTSIKYRAMAAESVGGVVRRKRLGLSGGFDTDSEVVTTRR